MAKLIWRRSRRYDEPSFLQREGKGRTGDGATLARDGNKPGAIESKCRTVEEVQALDP
jgi:hypothetical protein